MTHSAEQYLFDVDGKTTTGLNTFLRSGREEPICSEEVVSAELTVTSVQPQEYPDLDVINQSLQRINSELERYTNSADKLDYALAIGSGILCGRR